MKRLVCIFIVLFLVTAAGIAREKAPDRYILGDIQKVSVPVEGLLAGPVPSPDGRYLAFTKENFQGLHLFDVETGTCRELTTLPGTGFGFDWSNGGVLAYRATLSERAGKHVMCVAHPDGLIEVASPVVDSVSLPLWAGDNLHFVLWEKEPRLITAGPDDMARFDEIVFCHPSGRLSIFDYESRAIEAADSYSQQVFFLPRISRNLDLYLVHSLDGHLYLGKAGSQSLTDIGEGSNARFAMNDEMIVFERTADDGHRIISSDLFLYDIGTGRTFRLTNTRDRLERMPAMANDGRTLFFIENGTIMRGVVR